MQIADGEKKEEGIHKVTFRGRARIKHVSENQV